MTLRDTIATAVKEATLSASSPWCNRVAAAAYAQCSTSEIDRAANAGTFRRYMRGGTPVFKKAEIDRAIERGEWLRRKAAA